MLGHSSVMALGVCMSVSDHYCEPVTMSYPFRSFIKFKNGIRSRNLGAVWFCQETKNYIEIVVLQ